jgi:PTH1 family peptidyl-tRNA hydrolase
MKLIIGLGNPGRKHQDTRHNVGFIVIDKLLNDLRDKGYELSDFLFDKSSLSEISEGSINEEKVVLIKPQTYMNRSGHAVKSWVDFYKLDPGKDVLVIYDDVDLPLGEVRTKGESAGGHRGMQSIIDHLNTNKIQRIRIGILAKPKEEIDDASRYVLQKLKSKERKSIDEATRGVLSVIKEFIKF